MYALISMLFTLVFPSFIHAAMLGIPASQTTVSGVGVVSGWKCVAGNLTVRFDNGRAIPLLHGAERKDVLDAGQCSHAAVGFLTIINWNELGDGPHTAVVYDDGVEFARARFRVVTPGKAFLASRSWQGQCVADDFPAPGDTSRFQWNQATQHMELAEVSKWINETGSPGHPTNADLDFLLDQETWTIEVPDLLSWQYISQWEHPEWDTLNPDNGGRGGNRYVAGPAEVSFLRYQHGATSNRLYPFSAVPPWGIDLTGIIQGTKVAGVDRLGNVVLKPALRALVEVGTLTHSLPMQTREAIGELDDGYSLVLPRSQPGTTQGNRCYILVFDDFRRLTDGGLEAQARFYVTARTPYADREPRYCVPPVYLGGSNGRAVPQTTNPSGMSRLLIY